MPCRHCHRTDPHWPAVHDLIGPYGTDKVCTPCVIVLLDQARSGAVTITVSLHTPVAVTGSYAATAPTA